MNNLHSIPMYFSAPEYILKIARYWKYVHPKEYPLEYCPTHNRLFYFILLNGKEYRRIFNRDHWEYWYSGTASNGLMRAISEADLKIGCYHKFYE